MPELRPSDLVVMDNLSSHKRDAVRERTEAAGATLRFLQPRKRANYFSSCGCDPMIETLEATESATPKRSFQFWLDEAAMRGCASSVYWLVPSLAEIAASVSTP